MNSCSNLYFLSTIACQLAQCFTEDELELIAANLKALGEMVEVILLEKHKICENNQK